MRCLVPLLLLGCSNAIDVHPDVGITVAVVVEPQFASPGDAVTVTVRATNLNDVPLELRFSSTCIFAYAILNADEELVAPLLGCGDAFTDHTFPVGVSEASFTFTVGDPDHPLMAGNYQVYGGLGFPLVIVSEPQMLQVTTPEFHHVP